MMNPAFVLMNETLDVDEFLCDVAMHLRRREMRMLLGYIGLTKNEIDELLYENMPRTGTERGLLTSHGAVVEGSSSVNFMDQRKKSMRTWWEQAAHTRQRNTPSQQKMKIVESTPCLLPQIPEDSKPINTDVAPEFSDKITETTVFPPIIPAPIQKHFEDSLVNEDDLSSISTNIPEAESNRSQKKDFLVNHLDVVQEQTNDDSKLMADSGKMLTPAETPSAKVLLNTNSGNDQAEKNSVPIVQVPGIEIDSDTLSSSKNQTNAVSVSDVSEQAMIDKSQQTDLIGCDRSPDQVAIYGSNITLEELLRKLWRSLQACGLNRVIEDLQQRWMIRIDVNQGRADMYPKMTWGTPLPPQTPFTYPPFKKIGHMAVMGSTMSIETKPTVSYVTSDTTPRLSKFDSGSIAGTARSLPLDGFKSSKFLSGAAREQAKTRSAKSRGLASISLDGSPVTSFPTRDAWKLRTDTVRRKGATISIHVCVSVVSLPTQPSTTWGSSLNVSPQQVRERVARVFLSHVLQDTRNLCKAVDRIERIRGLVVESALKRIGGSGNSMEMANSELVLQCRCLHPETVEQLWLLYQSGQLRETIQAGLVTKRAQHACAVDHLQMHVSVAEEEYRRALGLLRRKPMPNTKTGRFYVTSGTGGVVGGTAGLAHAQKQALMSVTRYMKLPTPTPSFQTAELGVPPTTALTYNEMAAQQKSYSVGVKPRGVGNLVHKVLSKELDLMKERLRMCEDTWCDFAANQLANMLNCASHVMQRRIVGATGKNQLTPRCTSMNIFLALYKAIKSPKTSGAVTSPRARHATPISGNHSNIALYPSDIAFANVDLVTTMDDDEDVIKSRKKEEYDFLQGYVTLAQLLSELGACRTILQERIIGRLNTNPTVAPSKHLYLAKDIYHLMERWRHLLVKDFNYAHDEPVQRLSSRILSNNILTPSLERDIQEQFSGIIGLLPMMFHIAEQIMIKLRELLPRPEKQQTSRTYPVISTPRSGVIQSKHLALWLSASSS